METSTTDNETQGYRISEPGLDSPLICYDPSHNYLSVKGNCKYEEGMNALKDAEDILREHLEMNNEIRLELNLDSISGAVVKSIINTLNVMKNAHNNGRKVLVDWYYNPEDECLNDIGTDFASLYEYDFTVMPYFQDTAVSYS